MNKLLLEYEIKSKGYTIEEFCEHIGISKSAYYRKVRGVTEFTQGEIQKALDMLKISDPMPIFFANKVS